MKLEIKKQSILNKLITDFSVFILILLFFVAIINPISKIIYNEFKKAYLEESFGEIPNEILEGEYKELDFCEKLGEKDFICIVKKGEDLTNEDSTKDYCHYYELRAPQLTSEEVKLIPDEEKKPIVNRKEGIELNNEKHTYINLEYYKNMLKVSSNYYILDDKFEIIETDVMTNKQSFNEKELQLLQGKYLDKYFVSKLEFEDSNNQKNVILIFREYNLPRIIGSSKEGDEIISMILLVLLFVVATIFYLLRLYKNVRKPLNIINKGIDEFASGDRRGIIKYKGTKEFEMVCKNFNNMAIKLDEAENKKTRAEETNRQIIADISHDLKTPITVIKGYISAFLDDKINEDNKKDYYMRISKNANNMEELVEALGEYTKLNHPGFKLNMTCGNISEFARNYFIDKYQEFEIFHYKMEINIPNQDIYSTYDSFHLKRVLDNIIGNTFKYTEEGTCVYFEISADESYVTITIGDDGSGITDEIKDHIFEAFVTADASRSKGSGLGMAIVKMIIEYHHGTINVVKDIHDSLMYEIKLPKEF